MKLAIREIFSWYIFLSPFLFNTTLFIKSFAVTPILFYTATLPFAVYCLIQYFKLDKNTIYTLLFLSLMIWVYILSGNMRSIELITTFIVAYAGPQAMLSASLHNHKNRRRSTDTMLTCKYIFYRKRIEIYTKIFFIIAIMAIISYFVNILFSCPFSVSSPLLEGSKNYLTNFLSIFEPHECAAPFSQRLRWFFDEPGSYAMFAGPASILSWYLRKYVFFFVITFSLFLTLSPFCVLLILFFAALSLKSLINLVRRLKIQTSSLWMTPLFICSSIILVFAIHALVENAPHLIDSVMTRFDPSSEGDSTVSRLDALKSFRIILFKYPEGLGVLGSGNYLKYIPSYSLDNGYLALLAYGGIPLLSFTLIYVLLSTKDVIRTFRNSDINSFLVPGILLSVGWFALLSLTRASPFWSILGCTYFLSPPSFLRKCPPSGS